MEPPSFTRILVPPYYRMQPKIFKNLALYCCWACLKVSKMVCHNLIAQKLTKKIGSLKMGFCQIRALVVGPMGIVTSPNNRYDFCPYSLWKFGKDSNIQSKGIQFMPTDRHTFCKCKNFFYTEIYTFSLHYIHLFALLTHSLHLWV